MTKTSPTKPAAVIVNLRDERRRQGLAHLHRLAIRGTISDDVITGRYMPADRISWSESLRELGTLMLFCVGLLTLCAVVIGLTWGFQH